MSWAAPDGVLDVYNNTGVRHPSRKAIAVWLSGHPVRYAVVASRGVWRSLVACFVRDEEVVGSNPATPTGVFAGRGPDREFWSGPSYFPVRSWSAVDSKDRIRAASSATETCSRSSGNKSA